MTTTLAQIQAARVAMRQAQTAHEEAVKARVKFDQSPEQVQARHDLQAALAAIPPRKRGAPAERARLLAEAKQRNSLYTSLEALALADATAARAKLDELIQECTGRLLAPVVEAVYHCLRVYEIVVRFGAPDVRVDDYEDGERYSKKYHAKYGPVRTSQTIVTVPPDWDVTVAARGLAVCDELFTLSATPITAPAGYEAFRAAWIVQGRGYSARAEGGVIVHELGRGHETAHVTCYNSDHLDEIGTRAAINSGLALLRRRAATRWHTAAAKHADLTLYRHVLVTFADSKRVGNCDPGTRSWCARAGLDPAAGATVGQVLDALTAGAGLDSLAIAACRAAVARSLERAHARVEARTSQAPA